MDRPRIREDAVAVWYVQASAESAAIERGRAGGVGLWIGTRPRCQGQQKSHHAGGAQWRGGRGSGTRLDKLRVKLPLLHLVGTIEEVERTIVIRATKCPFETTPSWTNRDSNSVVFILRYSLLHSSTHFHWSIACVHSFSHCQSVSGRSRDHGNCCLARNARMDSPFTVTPSSTTKGRRRNDTVSLLGASP